MPASDPRYKTRRWQETRRFVLIRDGELCQMRGPGCTVHAPLAGGHANHIVSPEDGGEFFDPGNLEAACRHCNTADGARRGNAKRARTTYRPSREW